MFRTIIGFCIFIFSTAGLADCEVDNSVLGAAYRVTHQSGTTAPVIYRMHLWRNGQQVAHQYPGTQITEIWERVSNGMLRLERHFDAYQRGIEYQPLEINKGKGVKDWTQKNQLISERLKDSLQLQMSSGEGCQRVEHYALNDNGSTIHLAWLPALKLVKHYRVASDMANLTWELENTVQDSLQVQQAFATRAAYQTTDYTDIGDNESDPFLLKMINLGFVEHGSSGFYNTEGHAIEGGHAHTH